MNEPRDMSVADPPGAFRGCPELEDLASYVDGRLDGPARGRFEEHVADCDRCRELLAEVARTPEVSAAGAVVPMRPRRVSRRIWVGGGILAAAASVVLAIKVIEMRRGPAGEMPELRELVAAVGQSRTIEPRLTGGFAHAPLAISRAGEPASLPPAVRIATARVEEAAAGNRSAAALDALGIALVLQRRFDQAIEALEEAKGIAPANPRILSDLSAAHFARGSDRSQAADLAKALAFAEEAAQRDPRLAEALFNRAVALEALHLRDQALRAWDEYLRVDPASPWAEEARQRRQRISSSGVSRWEADRDALLQAADADRLADETARIKANAQQLREYFDGALLAAWADATLTQDSQLALRWLRRARRLAAALQVITTDPMPRDAVELIESAAARDSPRLARLARGHRAFADARRLYENDEAEKSWPLFEVARSAFAEARSPFRHWSTLYEAVSLYRKGDLDPALEKLDALAPAAAANRYLEVQARAYWIKGLVHAFRAEFSDTLHAYTEARALFDRMGEAPNAAYLHSLTAGAFDLLNEPARAWDARELAFRDFHRIASPRIRHTMLGAAVRAALRQDLPLAALHYQDSAVGVAREWGPPLVIAEQFLQRARIARQIGDRGAAARDLAHARAALAELATPSEPVEADVALEEARVHDVPVRAEHVRLVTDAIAKIARRGLSYRLAESYLVRARLELALGRDREAEADLHAAIAAFERYRMSQRQSQLRVSYAAEGADLYLELVRFLVARGRTDAALEVAERGRARTLLDALGAPAGLSAAHLTRKLADIPARTVLLYTMLLDDRLLVWTLTRRTRAFHNVAFSAGAVDATVRRLHRLLIENAPPGEIAEPASALYDAVVRPIRAGIDPGATVVVVPDGILHEVPFAALIDRERGRFLIEDHPIAVAPSLAVFFAASSRLHGLEAPVAPPAVLSVGVRTADARAAGGLRPLPQAEDEARAVASLYGAGVVTLVRSDATKRRFLQTAARHRIIHIAGHALANADQPWLSRLFFAQDSADPRDSVLSAYEINDARFPLTTLIVLAGCQTARGAVAPGEGAVSLARAFLAAGIPTVLSTLWDLDDRTASALFVSFHRHFRDGGDPARALQQAAVGLMKSGDAGLASPRVWAGVVVVGAVTPAQVIDRPSDGDQQEQP